MTAIAVQSKPIGIKVAAALAGALFVAAAAQVAIPIPGSPIPFTLQPMAVLIVGGLLGARYGALSLAMYLALGAMGLPVFAPVGLPGLARLMGPTGGFLISYPFAAALTGRLAKRPFVAALLGMCVIFIGGASQLAILGGNVAILLTPFLAADLVKVLLAGLVIKRFAASTSALT